MLYTASSVFCKVTVSKVPILFFWKFLIGHKEAVQNLGASQIKAAALSYFDTLIINH